MWNRRDVHHSLLCLLAATAMTAAAEPQTRLNHLPLGRSRVDILVHDVPPPAGLPGRRWVLINVHDDENTAVEAALDVLRETGGRLIELRHTGRRTITFRTDSGDHTVDPNRIFTPVGRRATLENLSSWSPQADDAVARFADAVLEACDLEGAEAVVAVHNNSPGRYDVTWYAAEGSMADDAEDVRIVTGSDPDDFLFTTSRPLFDALARRNRNVALQDNRRATDDGSLSVACGRRGILYVNVEAEHGHREKQAELIRDVAAALDELAAVAANPPPEVDLVDLVEFAPGLVIDARYATADNPTGQRLYPVNKIFLERSAAERLARVQRRLTDSGLGLKVFDGYRPLAVQRELWRAMPDPRYVADPVHGSRHNRGSAVDVTLVDADGRELAMPTAFDEFDERAHLDYQDLPPEAIRNRETLQQAMRAEGFLPLATEWWHFDAPDWQRFPLMDRNPYDGPLFPDRVPESNPDR